MKQFKPAYIFLLLWCCIIHTDLIAQNYISKSKVKRALKEFVKNPLLKSASVSFLMTDLRNHKKLAGYDEHRALIPASSQKIISCAFILNALSGSYTFKTPFVLKGEIQSDGNFNGNLEIIGKGDPSFASEYFPELPNLQSIADTLSKLLKEKGISKITGNIIVNEQFITDVPENKEWLWYDLGNYYGAGCFGFNYAENQARITLASSTKDGGICAIVDVQPSQLLSNYSSRVIGKNKIIEQDVYVLGNSQSCKQEILGEWKCCMEDTLVIRSALAKPSEVFINLLKSAMRKNGIIIEEKYIANRMDGEFIYSYNSPMLQDMVQRALNKSVNLYCESFVHLFGFTLNGSTDRQLALLKMNQMLTGILSEGEAAIIEDGSGLSPKNMISASGFVDFLQWIHQNDSLQYFWQLLPDQRRQGSLSKWLKTKDSCESGMRLKSGSMERVRSYSGYLVYKDQPIYALSLMVNHYTCSGELINELIANFFNQMQHN